MRSLTKERMGLVYILMYERVRVMLTCKLVLDRLPKIRRLDHTVKRRLRGEHLHPNNTRSVTLHFKT